jgi:hypothetical protein
MKENESNQISHALKKLELYARENKYSGYDPYDALNSKYIQLLKNKYIYLAATQFFVYSPINFRSFLKIERGINPKALGLFLQAYCKMYRTGFIEKELFDSVSYNLANLLINSSTKGYSGYCWGFNFDWQDLTRYSKKNLPTIVITSYIGHALLDLYDINFKKKYLEIASSCCDFILKDLKITKNQNGICFSYTPIDAHIVHNANLLGASLLARVYSITKHDDLLAHSKNALDFTISCQKDCGAWAYSEDRFRKKERHQIDFHQGFILDSICDFIKYARPKETKYMDSLLKGAKFYMEKQFDNDGRSSWRLPYKWPIDIHNQAQGIITACKIYCLLNDEKYLTIAEKISLWTLENLGSNEGYFYYQKWPLFVNKISYMRWSQAWMLKALSNFVNCKSYYRR